MVTLKFIYSTESELARVVQTTGRLEFYREHGYIVFFPENFTPEKFDLVATTALIQAEMPSTLIDNTKQEISTLWEQNQSLIEDLLSSTPYSKPEVIDLVLTKYGVGGSYSLPNRIVINVQYKIKPFQNVMHELTHLLIEQPIVKAYGLDHAHKEGLVDWIMMNHHAMRIMFPSYTFQKGLSVPPSEEDIREMGLVQFI